MLFTAGPLAGQLSGRLGSVIAARNRGGSYFRNGTIPITSTTAEALAAKARLGALSTGWQSLTDAQRLAWQSWAQNNPVVNRLGQSITLQGNAAYISINARLLQAGGAAVDSPPIIPAPQPLASLTSTGDIGAGAFGLIFTPTPTGAAENLRIRAAVVRSAGINFIDNDIRVAGHSGVAEASPFDSQAIIEARLGALTVGDVVHQVVDVLDTTNGQVSLALRTRVTVTST